MPRPVKCRRVCSLPLNNMFGPVKGFCQHPDHILMTVEEYETIRLIDFEEMLQEECAEKMEVARTTVQRIYNSARKKIALSLVEGKVLKIEGGDYKICEENNSYCGCRKCKRKTQKKECEND